MKHKLMLGDCLELMKEIGSGTVDMILCDLPYGSTQCKWDVIIPFEKLWPEYERVIKENGAIVLFAAQPFAAVLATSNLKLFRYEIIWEKPSATGFLNAKKQPLRAHENILVFYKSQPTYNPQKTFGHERKTAKRKDIGSEHYGKQVNIKSYDSTERYPRSVQVFSSDKQKSNFHPTQKPVALLEYLIKTYTQENETVLDSTAGSMSTAIACINTNRKGIMIEKDDHYFKVGSDRVAQALLEKRYERPER